MQKETNYGPAFSTLKICMIIFFILSMLAFASSAFHFLFYIGTFVMTIVLFTTSIPSSDLPKQTVSETSTKSRTLSEREQELADEDADSIFEVSKKSRKVVAHKVADFEKPARSQRKEETSSADNFFSNPVKLFGSIGGIMLVLGIIFFITYAIQVGLISPLVQILLGCLLGVSLFAMGQFKRFQVLQVWSSIISSVGFSITYFCVFASYYLESYRAALQSSELFTLALLIIIAGSYTGYMVKKDNRFLASYGFLFTYLSSLFISAQPLLFAVYVFIITASCVYTVIKKNWNVLGYAALAVTYILTLIHLQQSTFAVQFALLVSAYALSISQVLFSLTKKVFQIIDYIAFTIGFFLVSWLLFSYYTIPYFYVVCLGISLVSFLLLKKLGDVTVYVALGFVALAVLFEANQFWITTIWSILLGLVALLYLKTQEKPVLFSLYILSGITTVLSLVYTTWNLPSDLSARLIIYLVHIASLLWCAYVCRKETYQLWIILAVVNAVLFSIVESVLDASVLYFVYSVLVILAILLLAFKDKDEIFIDVVSYMLLAIMYVTGLAYTLWQEQLITNLAILALLYVATWATLKKYIVNAVLSWLTAVFVAVLTIAALLQYNQITYLALAWALIGVIYAAALYYFKYPALTHQYGSMFILSALAALFMNITSIPITVSIIVIGYALSVYNKAPLYSALYMWVSSSLLFVHLIANLSSYYLSIGWALFGFTLLIVGMFADIKPIRHQSALVLAITILKVFIIDTQTLAVPFRIVTFIVLGVLLLAAAYLYSKYSDKIKHFF